MPLLNSTSNLLTFDEYKEARNLFQRVQRKDPTASQKFSLKVQKQASNYKWPLAKKNASIEEQILSPMHHEPKLLKTDLSLNTVVEASKQIRQAARQTSLYRPSDIPLTPFMVSSATQSQRQRIFGSPKTSIKVSNLMSNGLSYPAAKKIYKKSLIKQRAGSQHTGAYSINRTENSVHSIDELYTSDSEHQNQ